LLFICLCLAGHGRNAPFVELSELNKCWRAQPDVAGRLPAPAGTLDETGWIRLDLQLAEQPYRSRRTAGLRARQPASRPKSLDDLHAYWQGGRFPVNVRCSYRTPIFIDRYDNFCAVGSLVQASGNEAVSRMIAAKTNLAYVHDMKYPQLLA